MKRSVVSVLALVIAAAVACNEAPPPRSLTDKLVELQTRYSQSPEPDLLVRMVEIARERQAELLRLARTDPGRVLDEALPDATRSSMPEAVRALLERRAELVGEVEVLCEYGEGSSPMRINSFLVQHSPAARHELHFVDEAPALTTGDRLGVHGVAVSADVFVVERYDPQLQLLSALTTTGQQTVLAVLVGFQDEPENLPYTASDVDAVLFGSVDDYYQEVSYGATSIAGQTVGPYVIAQNSTVCDYNELSTLALQAASDAGVDTGAYRRYMFIFPKNACGWAGLGTVGGNPSRSYVNGSLKLRTVGHELGHNFGLYHSHALICDAGTISGSCVSDNYGNTTDIMGKWPASGHFNAFQKRRLGYLDAAGFPSITEVQATGTYHIDAYENQSTAAKALRIVKETDLVTGAMTYYYVELRQATGVDSYLSSYPGLTNGVVVNIGTEGAANSNHMLDMTPDTSGLWDAALAVGQSYTDAAAGVTIEVLSAGAGGSDVRVTIGPSACVRGDPAVSIAPTSAWAAAPGTTLQYTATVTNLDSSACDDTTFALAGSAPAGWTATLDSSSVSLAPGASAAVVFSVASPADAADGTYNASLEASSQADASYSSSGSASYVLGGSDPCGASPTVTVTPASQSGAPGAPLQYSVAVKNNDSSECPAIDITRSAEAPPGWTVNLGSSFSGLPPGWTVTTTMTVTSPTAAVNGSYDITVTAANAAKPGATGTDTAAYEVQGAPTCTRAAPAVALAPSTQTVAPGEAATLTLSVTNNDSGACGSSSFSREVSVPAGWTASSLSGVTLSPGQSASTTVTVTSSASAADGGHTVAASADNGASSPGSGSATVVVDSNLSCTRAAPTVALSPATVTVAPGDDAQLTVTVTNNDSTACGASSFDRTISVPAGWSASALAAVSLTPGQSATATVTVSSSASASDGSYTVSFTADNGVSEVSSDAAVVVDSSLSCARAAPTVTLSPGDQSGAAGSALTYTLSVTNEDSGSCGTSSFSRQATVPVGWTTSALAAVTLAPGQSATASVTVTSPTSAAAGGYTVEAAAGNQQAAGFEGTATARYTVVAATKLELTVSTDRAAYAAGDTVQIVAELKDGAPVSKAPVTLTVTMPSGATKSRTVRTSGSGRAVLRYRLSKRSAELGTYTVDAAASHGGEQAAASTSFSVGQMETLAAGVGDGSLVGSCNVADGGSSCHFVSVMLLGLGLIWRRRRRCRPRPGRR